MTSAALAPLFGALVLLLAIRVPVGFALLTAGLIGNWMVGMPALTLPQAIYGSLDSFLLIAVPLFILSSALLTHGGISRQLFDLAAVWVRHLPGGLGIATVLTCAIFAAVCGSSVATAAAVGGVAYPELTSRGYDKRFVTGLLAAGGTLGILIPPSIPMIIFGAVTDVSVGALFVAGIVPGLILTFVLVSYVIARAYFAQHKRVEAASWPERWRATRKAIWGLTLPPIIIGGIYTGAFTPSEAAAVAASVSLVLGIINSRHSVFANLWPALMETARTTSMLCILIAGAILFGQAMTVGQVPQALSQTIDDLGVGPLAFVFLANLMFLVLGCFLEVISIMLTTLPILYPTILSLGVDPIWFAIVMVVNMELALITPPVGLNLFVIQGMTKLPLHDVMRGVLPFVVAILLVLVFFIMVPEVTQVRL